MESKHCALDELLDNDFCSFTYDGKYTLKNIKSAPHLSLDFKDGQFTRKFQSSWSNKFTWFSGCNKRNKFFFFVCVFFRGEKEGSILFCRQRFATKCFFFRLKPSAASWLFYNVRL